MSIAFPRIRFPGWAEGRSLVWPREHGSWSLALEPLVLGLLAAPSTGGAWLAVAVVAGFFCRRPLRLVGGAQGDERRAAARGVLIALGTVAVGATLMAMARGPAACLLWLLPAGIGGSIFLGYDWRDDGRKVRAEIAGATAFALMPAALAALAGWPAAAAGALAVVMLGRTIPTVLVVRAAVRAVKSVGPGREEAGWRAALAASGLALAAGGWLAGAALAPWSAPLLLGGLTLRALILLVFPRPILRARTIGLIEAVLGAVFVIAAGFAWTR